MSWHLQDNLFGSALLMLVVLGLRKPTARLFGARAAFALWLAPVLRLLSPRLPVNAPMPDIVIQSQTVAASAVEPVRAALPVGALVALAWGAGAILFLAFHLIKYLRFVGAAEANGRVLPALSTAVPVIETSEVSGPAAAGLIRRRIFVPAGFTHRFDDDQQRLALQHELFHHRRGDLWASAAALVVLALHWVNPLAYAAHRAFRRDLEAACDADLLAIAPRSDRHLYAGTILRCVAGPVPNPVCALTDSKELKGRLKMMKQDISFMRRMSGAAVALALSAGGLAVAIPAAAQTPPAEPQQRTEIRKIIVRDGKGEREISPELQARIDKCRGQKIEVNGQTGTPATKLQRTRILICAKPGESNEQMASSLEKALGRIESQSELSAEAKADMVAKLKERIAELRAGE